jgi:predicted porin
MQKKLIALAIAGLSSTAFAQSNVTISGVIKGGYDSTKISGGTGTTGSQNQISDQASSFVLSGSEALGNGLSAIFRIDNRFGIDGLDNNTAPNGGIGAGNTHIGLKSASFGEIKLGTQDLHYNEIERIENGAKSLSQQAMVGRGILSQVGGNNFVGNGTTRTKNVVFWDSPNWSGFTARVAYSTGYSADESNTAGNNVATKVNQGDSWNLVGRYENGPIKAGVSHLKTEADGTAAAVRLENTSTRAWGSYNIAGFSLGLAYDTSKQENHTAIGDSRKRNGWAVPVSYSFGSHGVYATYAKVDDIKTQAGDTANSGAKQWTIGYSYDLSKRTSVGVNYTKIDNESAASYRQANFKGNVPNAGQDVSQFYAGVRHAF